MNSVFTTFALVGLVTLALWAATALIWNPDEVAPWRVSAVHLAQTDYIEEKKKEKKERKKKNKNKKNRQCAKMKRT